MQDHFSKYQSFIYLHVYASGELYVLSSSGVDGAINHYAVVAELIEESHKAGAVLLYSLEDTDELFTDSARQLVTLLEEGLVMSGCRVEPHPRTYGYDRSYIPHLNLALETAIADAQLLETELDRILQTLSDQKHDLTGRAVLDARRVTFEQRLGLARDSLKKILELHFDLCLEPGDIEM
jgi:hypothetical protein